MLPGRLADVSDNEIFIAAAEGTRAAVIGEAALVFVPGRDGLFEVDPFVTGLWPQLKAGMSARQFFTAARCMEKDGAAMLRDLRDAGAVIFIGTDDGPRPATFRMAIGLGRLNLGVNFSGRGDFRPLRDMLAHLQGETSACDRHLVVVGEPERIGLALSGEALAWHRWEQAGPALKMMLTDLALDALDGIALHTATLAKGEEALLIAGDPGAGKSTLAVALGAAGFRLEGDDIAALLSDGCVMGLPFPATVKAGAWEVLGPCRGDLASLPTYLRPDGQRVRYLALERGAPAARRIRLVLWLDRTKDAGPPGLAPLDVRQAVAALIAGAWSADRRLAPRDFDALLACVAGAAFYRMTYSTLAEAVALVKQAWRDAEATTPGASP